MLKKTFSILITLFCLANASAQEKFTPDINLQNVTGVIINGATEVKLEQQLTPEISIIASPEIKENMTVAVNEQGQLLIDFGSDINKFFKSKKNRPNIYISLPKLNYLKISGVANVLCSGTFKTDEEFVLITNGKSFVEFLNVKAPKINVSTLGVSQVSEMKVNTAEMTVEANNVSSANIIGEVSGKMILRTNNTGSINTLNVKCPDIKASAFGMSNMKVHIETKAHVEAGGTSSFRYTGTGAVSGDGGKKL